MNVNEFSSAASVCWRPTPAQIASANVTRFISEVVHSFAGAAADVHDAHSLYAWSSEHPELFWPGVWRFCGIVADDPADGLPWDQVLVGADRVAPPDPTLGPRWFTGARLNFAENLLRRRDDHRDHAAGERQVVRGIHRRTRAGG